MIGLLSVLLPLKLLFIGHANTQTHLACMAPAPPSNFTLQGYYGLWYGIGRFQTPGGADFDDECVCTTVEVRPKTGATSEGDSTAHYSCRKNTVTGKTYNATSELTEMDKPGHWKEKFSFFTRAVNYTVVYMDENFAVGYDCGENLGKTNYCIYILARSPIPDFNEVKHLAVWSIFQGLNTEEEAFLITNQTKCW